MAASAWQKMFPPGRGLVNIDHLNRIFTGASKVQAMEMATMTVDTSLVLAAGATITGQNKGSLVTVAATGASAGTARSVGTTASLIVVTNTASTEGVKLPTAATGLVVTVMAPTALATLVYAAAAGQSIGTGTTNTTAFKVTANTSTTFVAASKTKWRVSVA